MTKDEALRAALAMYYSEKDIAAIKQALKQSKCNPHPNAPHGYDRTASIAEGRDVCECESWQPKREWVGLTDEDDLDWEEGGSLKDLVKAIEAKLKEKNNV